MKRKTRILFVDDDEVLGEMMAETLELMGYEAQTEADPEKAFMHLTRHPDSVDAVILDQRMPGVTGLELARWLSEIRPDLPMILITADPDIRYMRVTEVTHIRTILYKPVTQYELLQALRNVLPARPAAKLRLICEKSD